MWGQLIITPVMFTRLVKMEQAYVVIKVDNFCSP